MESNRIGASEASNAAIRGAGFVNGKGKGNGVLEPAVARPQTELIIEEYNEGRTRVKRQVYWTSLGALVFGALLIFARYQFGGPGAEVPVMLEVMRDLGIGFAVGAAVGIFYEGIIKVDEKVRNEVVLRGSLEKLDDAAQQMRGASEVFARLENSESALRQSLDDILPNRKYSDIKTSLMKLVSYLNESRALENHIDSKEVNEYVGLLNWLVSEYVVKAADEFNDLFRGLAGENERRAFFRPPERRAVTLQMLSAQMNAMTEGDSYDSLTNAWLYRNMSDEYISASCRALIAGVEIRRIFNICTLEADTRENFNEAKAIIQTQIARFSSLPTNRFHCRFLTCGTLSKIHAYTLEQAKVNRIDEVKQLTFGHFHHRATGNMIRFDPQRPDMSIMKINVYPNGGDDNDADCYSRLFEHLWEVAEREVPV